MSRLSQNELERSLCIIMLCVGMDAANHYDVSRPIMSRLAIMFPHIGTEEIA